MVGVLPGTVLAKQAEISKKISKDILELMLSESAEVERLTFSSFLDETTQRNYWQAYQKRLKQLAKE